MVIRYVLAFLCGLHILSAQTYQFEEIVFPNQITALDLIGSSNKALTHADVDGDGDEDIFLLKSEDDENFTSLYFNEGNGNYTKAPYDPFPYAIDGSVSAFDIDGDDDLDLIISGTFEIVGEGLVPRTYLYYNINNANYLLSDVELTYLTNGSIKNTQITTENDFLVTGEKVDGDYYTGFYGGTTEFLVDDILPSVINSNIAVVDLNGDGVNDFILQGETMDDGAITKAYEFDTDDFFEAVFNEFTGAVMLGLSHGTVDHIDIDGDDDADILITGIDDLDNITSKLYTNDGLGNLTEVIGTPFPNLYQGSVSIGDYDNTNGLDIFMTGISDAGENFTGLFLNDGVGNFALYDTGFNDQFGESSSDAFDADGDGDLDLVVNGTNQAGDVIIKLYFNDGGANFSEVQDEPLRNIKESAVAFADVDDDGDIDFGVTGINQLSKPATLLYINDGVGNYELSANALVNLSGGDLAFADIDGDDDLDLFNIGWDKDNVYQTKIYLNNGVGDYTDAETTDFEIIGSTSCAFTDIDNDNNIDLILYGYSVIGDDEVLFYLNDGSGSYSLTESGIYGLNEGGFAIADVDGDGDIDFFQSGASTVFEGKLYLNNEGVFSESPQDFIGRLDVDILFRDIDNDNDQDLLVVGVDNDYSTALDVYFNDGLGTFTLTEAGDFNTAANNRIALGDIDNDGDSDLLLTTIFPPSFGNESVAVLFQNDGNGYFNEIESDFFKPTANGAIAFADIDGDNDQDIFLSGEDTYRLRTNLYRNETIASPIFTSFTCEGAFSDAIIDVDNAVVELYVSQDTDLSSIIATYELSYDSEVYVDGLVQESGISTNDFTDFIEYDLTDFNGDIHHWLVEINYVSILDVKVILEAAYEDGLDDGLFMHTQLRDEELLPFFNPYTGDVSLDPTILEGENNTDIVDWIEVEVRIASDPENGVGDTVLGNYYGFLRNDGKIMDTSGQEGIYLFGVTEPVYVVIKHRNHLNIMTSEAIVPNVNFYGVNFTTDISQTYQNGQNGMDGLAMMYLGDANGDGIIKFTGANNDSNRIFLNIYDNYFGSLNFVLDGYYNADVNMDGEVKYVGANNDSTPIFNQIDGNTNLNNQIIEQVPEVIED